MADPAFAVDYFGMQHGNMIHISEDGSPNPFWEGAYAGYVFESLIELNLRNYLDALPIDLLPDVKMKYLGIAANDANHAKSREVDFILERKDGNILPIEVKYKSRLRESDFEHLTWVKKKLGDQVVDAALLYTGTEAYRRGRDGIAVIPAALLAHS